MANKTSSRPKREFGRLDRRGKSRLPVGLRQRLRERGAARRPAGRAQQPAEVPLRPLRGADFGLTLHGAAHHQQRSWLYRIRPTVKHWGRFEEIDAGLWRTAPVPRQGGDPAAAMEPDADPEGEFVLHRRRADHHHGRRCRHPRRHGDPRLSRHPLHAGRVLLQRRCRDDAHPAAGPHPDRDRVRPHRRRAVRDRRHPARGQDPRRAQGHGRTRLPVRELWRRLHAARARTHRRQLPGQPA